MLSESESRNKGLCKTTNKMGESSVDVTEPFTKKLKELSKRTKTIEIKISKDIMGFIKRRET